MVRNLYNVCFLSVFLTFDCAEKRLFLRKPRFRTFHELLQSSRPLAPRACGNLFFDAFVARGLWNFGVLAGGKVVGTDDAGMDRYHFDAQRCHFQTIGVRDGSLGCFCAYIDACRAYSANSRLGLHLVTCSLTHPWCVDARRYGADVHDGTFGGYDELCEGLRHAECALDADVVHLVRCFIVAVKGRHNEHLTSVVNQVV